ncbi:leucyl aminopeptidase [Mycolicibacterium canariasense]|uniref:Probable cytosol aminopeptidase n=1 Tax=Mycolicibacterium canariasense TaxID=228230 RepID=A0A100W8C1_MYCCR|nr:leucyl aminopeptidase [Mycolicibacterium canariasense]MCV7212315.1 leucyl aminopeptidase [Mycolicibacterium canariasense]ORU98903.1 aminopeptidase [Mycolicibacterium canariasense]GAS93286.1 leucyl aminopeptidase [Mycolicibacterium canariasense]
MSSASGYQAPSVTLSSSLPRRGTADAVLVVGVVSGDDGPRVLGEHLDTAAVAAIESALEALGGTGGEGQQHRLVIADLPVASVLTVGLGEDRDAWPADSLRRAAGNAARALDKVATVVTTLTALDLEAAIEGLILGAYRFTEFRSDKTAPKDKGLTKIVALAADTKAATKATAQRAVDIASAVATARDFVNTPPSHLFPAEFAKRAKVLGEEAGLTVEVLDDKALAKAGYGGIVGVGQGSSRLPRLVRLTHKGAGRKGKAGGQERSDTGIKKVALVGKGITFDTGGISIKPAANMHHMTSDMGGAAAVIATVVLAAKQNLPIDVVATVPMAENMPSATAQRPGDVLTQYGGITVEVLNTDAEGRLILADAIVRACEDDPDYLIETSTLTGAQTVALGARTPGVMGSDEFRDRVAALSQEVGENGWAMPLPEELKDDLKSTVADLANVSASRYAGMLVAGTYLREFVAEGVEWAHIDIAAPAYNTGGPWGYTPKGGTGVPTRTMFAVLEDIARNG